MTSFVQMMFIIETSNSIVDLVNSSYKKSIVYKLILTDTSVNWRILYSILNIEI